MQHLVDDPERGIAWARGGLVFGVLASVAGNVANACLSHSSINVALRIPPAIFWPLALFAGIEIMVRNRHRRGAMALIGRVLLLAVSVPTFVTSYVNLYGFMQKAGEPIAAVISGPLAIDGLLLGCTVMLLAATLRTAEPAPLIVEVAPEPVSAVLTEVAAVVEQPKRAPRAVSADLEQAVRDMLADPERKPLTSTERRYARVIRMLKTDPRMEIDAAQEKVRPELVEIIRTEMKGVL